MQERINLAQWDNDNDPQMIKKIKEMNNMWSLYIIYSLWYSILTSYFIHLEKCDIWSFLLLCILYVNIKSNKWLKKFHNQITFILNNSPNLFGLLNSSISVYHQFYKNFIQVQNNNHEHYLASKFIKNKKINNRNYKELIYIILKRSIFVGVIWY
jgi:hypothetical protein